LWTFLIVPNFNKEKLLFSKGYKLILAIDEAGRGSLAGPVVAACIAIKENQDIGKGLWQEVRDSKQLSSKKREEIFCKIMANIKQIGIGIVDNITIDRINILQATFLAMKKAIGNSRVKADLIIVDGKFKIPNLSVSQIAFIKGDQNLSSIAAASIVAKVTRDKIMNEIDHEYPKYGFIQHKGYGTKEHLEKIRKFGPCPIHRLSFRPLKK
jgi:ribonuclease HII